MKNLRPYIIWFVLLAFCVPAFSGCAGEDAIVKEAKAETSLGNPEDFAKHASGIVESKRVVFEENGEMSYYLYYGIGDCADGEWSDTCAQLVKVSLETFRCVPLPTKDINVEVSVGRAKQGIECDKQLSLTTP